MARQRCLNAAAFDVIVKLWRNGEEVDVTAVASRMRAQGYDPGWQWFLDATKVAATVAPNAETIIQHRPPPDPRRGHRSPLRRDVRCRSTRSR
jgi:hypothetical protein